MPASGYSGESRRRLWTAQQAQVATVADPRGLPHQSTSRELVPRTNCQSPAVIPTQGVTTISAQARPHANTWNVPQHARPSASSYPNPESTQIYVASRATLNQYSYSASTYRQPTAPQQPTTQAAQTQSASTAKSPGAGTHAVARQYVTSVIQNVKADGLDRHDLIVWVRRKFPGPSSKAVTRVSKSFRGIGGEHCQVRISRYLTSQELQELDQEREVDESDAESSSQSSDDEPEQPKAKPQVAKSPPARRYASAAAVRTKTVIHNHHYHDDSSCTIM